MTQFILIGETVVNVDAIHHIDFSNIEDMRLKVYFTQQRSVDVLGIQVIDILMALKPSAFESRRMRWYRHIWSFHNLVGHPVMQILAFFKYYKAAMWVHDATVPRPRGTRNDFTKEKANGR